MFYLQFHIKSLTNNFEKDNVNTGIYFVFPLKTHGFQHIVHTHVASLKWSKTARRQEEILYLFLRAADMYLSTEGMCVNVYTYNINGYVLK